MFEKIYDVVTGETTEVPYSKEQLAEVKANQKEIMAKQAEAEAKQLERQAILDRLGLTADELKTILG
jgi:hypothetical protein